MWRRRDKTIANSHNCASIYFQGLFSLPLPSSLLKLPNSVMMTLKRRLSTLIFACFWKYICALKNIFVHWKIYFCTENICALKNIFVLWKIYLCNEKHLCTENIFVLWKIYLWTGKYLCTKKHLCTGKYICAPKNILAHWKYIFII